MSSTSSPGASWDARVAGAHFLDPRDETPDHRQELQAWMQLQASLGLNPDRARACLERTGNPLAALRDSGTPPAWSQRQIDEAIRVLARRGTLALPLFSPAYPARLCEILDPSPLLWVEGDARILAGRAVAIVGARAATVYGLEVARELASGLAEAGLVVVSGLARGIDAAAHVAALEAGGRTLAVQACGPDRVYPPEHRRLAAAIRANGAILTELPPGSPPRAPYFPLRNRLISGLCEWVVVVEARMRSGSLITARHAADQSREVAAVPGPITAPTSAGPNRLLRDGAACLDEGVESLLRLMKLSSPSDRRSAGRAREKAAAAGTSPEQREILAAPSPEQREILAALAREPATREELARRLGRAPEQLSLQLLDLELEDRVEVDRDGRLVAKRAKSVGGQRRGRGAGRPGARGGP